MKDTKSSKKSASMLFGRYIWLVDTIYRADGIKYEELNSKWVSSSLNLSKEDFPKRTFNNHREAVQGMFDINIVCDSKNNYKYYIENKDGMEPDEVLSWLLNTFTVSNMIKESKKLKDRILFELVPSGQEHLMSIIKAMSDGRTIEIAYKRFEDAESESFEAEPYCVKIFKQKWYLVAMSERFGALRIFALDRILAVKRCENSFTLPENFDAHIYFYDSYGIFVNDKLKREIVEVKVYGKEVNYFRALLLHHSQNEIETYDDYSIFEYFIKPTPDFCQELLSKGAKVEVLSPKSFRTEVANAAKEMSKRYE